MNATGFSVESVALWFLRRLGSTNREEAMLKFNFALTEDEIRAVEQLPESAWFTAVEFSNYTTPQPPALSNLDGANERKTATVRDWITKTVKDRTVMDTFCANGAFSFHAAAAGAASVTGVEWDAGRVAAAQLVASFLARHQPDATRLSFRTGDAYRLADEFPEPFDVTLCFGGLYHVADPPYILRQLRAVTRDYLIVQTSSIIKGKRNQASFRVRKARHAQDNGLTSIVAGAGKWYMTAECFREMLHHGGFEIVEERVHLPIYAALCKTA